jgi:RNA polymerase sigma factor (sigma-70 family)
MTNPRPLELAELLAARDEPARDAAWARLIDTHSRLLLRLAHSLGGDHDVVMDRYLFVIEKLRDDDYRRLRAFTPGGRARFTTWLLVVGRNLCLDHHRARYGRDRGTLPEDRSRRRSLADLSSCIDVSRIADVARAEPEPDPGEGGCHRALADALGTLAAADRLLLTCWFDDGLPAGEIAALLGYPTAFHVYRRIRTLCRTLRRELVAHGIEGRD